MRFIEMAEKNATIALKNKMDTLQEESLLSSMKLSLKLNKLPHRIESYDISNISGTDIVAGIVVFVDGKPKKDEYRRIRIKTVSGQDDIACMKEVLERRLKYLVSDVKSPFGSKPDLILMDGGQNQVNIANSIIKKFDLDIELYGMVKNDKHRTRALINKAGEEIDISENKALFNFVTYVQDEVHKTAIEYHRKLRSKHMSESQLDKIDGIGEKKKQELLKKFKTIKNIKEASIESLCEVKGINEELAMKIKQELK